MYLEALLYDYFMNNFMNSGLNLNAKASILMKFHAWLEEWQERLRQQHLIEI